MRKLIVMIGLALIVSACTEEGTTSESGWTYIGNSNYVKSFDIDGVECIVLDGYNGDGISCDWDAR